MGNDYRDKRELLERETIDFTVKVRVRDLIDLVADEAFAPEGEFSMRDIGPVDVYSYLGPAAALTAVKDHGWMFAEDHPGQQWIEAALMQSDENKFDRPIAESLGDARKVLAGKVLSNKAEVKAAPQTETAELQEAEAKRRQAFLLLETALNLDKTDHDELTNVVPMMVGSVRDAIDTLSIDEKSQLRAALSDLRPIIPNLNGVDLLRQVIDLVTVEMTGATKRLVTCAVEDCYPHWGWVAECELDMTGEMLDALAVIEKEAA